MNMSKETDKKRSIDDIAANNILLESSTAGNEEEKNQKKRRKVSEQEKVGDELNVTKEEVHHWTIIVKIARLEDAAESTYGYRIPTADFQNDTKIGYYINHREGLEDKPWAEYDKFMEKYIIEFSGSRIAMDADDKNIIDKVEFWNY